MNSVPNPFSDVRATAEKLVNNRHGITLTRKGDDVSLMRGYAVGGASHPTLRLSAESSHEALVEAVARYIQQTPTNVEYFGAWTEGGVIYVDCVDIVEKHVEAILLGHERGEAAIYRFADNSCEII